MNSGPHLLLSVCVVLIGCCLVLLRRNSQQLLLGHTLAVIGAAAILLQLLAERQPSGIWLVLPLSLLLAAGVKSFRQAVAHPASQRHCSGTER